MKASGPPDGSTSLEEVLYRYPPKIVTLGLLALAAFGLAIGVDNERGFGESLLTSILIAAVAGWRLFRMSVLDDGHALVSRGFFRTKSMPWDEIRNILPQGRGGSAWAVGDSRRVHLACVPPTVTKNWDRFRAILLQRVQSGRDK